MTAAAQRQPADDQGREAERDFAALKFRLLEAACADRRLKSSSAVKVLVVYVSWDRGSEPGKVFRTTEDMHTDTGLSSDAINSARKALIAAGYLEEVGKMASGAVQYRINYRVADEILEQLEALRRSGRDGESAYDEMPDGLRETEASGQRRKFRKGWNAAMRSIGQAAPGEEAFQNPESSLPKFGKGLTEIRKAAFRTSVSSTPESGNDTLDIPSRYPIEHLGGIPCADDAADSLEDDSSGEEEGFEALQGISDYAKASRGW